VISAERSVTVPSHSWMHDIISNLKTLKYLGHTQTMHAFVAEATTKVDR